MCADCVTLDEELRKQERISYGLRKRITSLKGERNHWRREHEKLLRDIRKDKKQHIRKGQKRGAYGRNG